MDTIRSNAPPIFFPLSLLKLSSYKKNRERGGGEGGERDTGRYVEEILQLQEAWLEAEMPLNSSSLNKHQRHNLHQLLF